MINEFEIIAWIKKQAPLFDDSLGIGDDAAVITNNSSHKLVVTTDALVEGVHFTMNSFKASDVGYKSLAVNISDLAAMGAKPRQVLVSLGIPSELSFEWIQGYYSGFFELCRKYSITLVGGNMTKSAKGFWCSITLMGEPISDPVFKRDAALIEDVICVSGYLGWAALGFEYLKRDLTVENDYTQRQKRPNARMDVAQFISRHEGVHAVMDISDGLSSDLTHLLRASQKNAQINLTGLMDSSFVQACYEQKLNPFELILNGGEDYELLLTVSANSWDQFECEAKQANLHFIPIGSIMPGEGVITLKQDDGSFVSVSPSGYRHF